MSPPLCEVWKCVGSRSLVSGRQFSNPIPSLEIGGLGQLPGELPFPPVHHLHGVLKLNTPLSCPSESLLPTLEPKRRPSPLPTALRPSKTETFNDFRELGDFIEKNKMVTGGFGPHAAIMNSLEGVAYHESLEYIRFHGTPVTACSVQYLHQGCTHVDFHSTFGKLIFESCLRPPSSGLSSGLSALLTPTSETDKVCLCSSSLSKPAVVDRARLASHSQTDAIRALNFAVRGKVKFTTARSKKFMNHCVLKQMD
ncbi:hypothetical protein T439DRAFT_332467 [Meredithblackwellia eburnea MCA 4105]